MSQQPLRSKYGLDITGNISVTGTVDGVDISVFKNQFDTHSHNLADLTEKSYLSLDNRPVIQDGEFSEKNFTTALFNKLNSIEDNANNYIHPNHTGEVVSTGDGATIISDNVIDADNLMGTSGALGTGLQGQALTASSTSKRFEWLTLGEAATYNVATSINETNKLTTSQLVKTYVDNQIAGMGRILEPVQSVSDAKAVTGMSDKDIMLIEDMGLYRYDAESSSTGNDNTIIEPNSGTGRWIKMSASINTHDNLSSVDKWNDNPANTYHVPNIDGNNSHFLDGSGNWSIPTGTYVHPNHTGDVTSSGDGATTLSNAVIKENHIRNSSGSALSGGQDTYMLGYDSGGTFKWMRPSVIDYAHGKSESFVHTNLGISEEVIYTFNKTQFQSAEFIISIHDVTNSLYESLKIIASHDGSEVNFNEYGNVYGSSSTGVSFNFSVNGNSVELKATGISNNNTIKSIVNLLNV